MTLDFRVSAISPYEGQDGFYERGFGGGVQWSPAGFTVSVSFWRWRIVAALWVQ